MEEQEEELEQSEDGHQEDHTIGISLLHLDTLGSEFILHQNYQIFYPSY